MCNMQNKFWANLLFADITVKDRDNEVSLVIYDFINDVIYFSKLFIQYVLQISCTGRISKQLEFQNKYRRTLNMGKAECQRL